MSLEQKIQEDLNNAQKQKDEKTISVLRMLFAEIKNQIIKLGRRDKPFSDDELIDIISKQVKQRNDSIKEYTAGGREDLAKNEAEEIEVLKVYMPEQLSDEELGVIIKEAIEQTGAESAKDIGNIMGVVMPKTKGKADGSKISEIVKKLLS